MIIQSCFYLQFPHLEDWSSFYSFGVQCPYIQFQESGGTMILKARYGGLDKAGESTDFNPYFGTDVGICSIVKPQLSFNQSLDNLPFWSKLFGPKGNIQAKSLQIRPAERCRYWSNCSFLKKGAHQSHLGRQEMGRLACTCIT